VGPQRNVEKLVVNGEQMADNLIPPDKMDNRNEAIVVMSRAKQDAGVKVKMKRLFTFETVRLVALTALLTGCGCAGPQRAGCAGGPKTGFVRIFDGKSFRGWQGNLDVFRIEDNAIVGGNLRTGIKRNEFLSTVGQYGDFEMRLKFKIVGSDTNAGVQFRSRRRPGSSEMIGYQADIGQQYWGSLYDESRRNKTLASVEEQKIAKILNRDGWNDYCIRCVGKHIELWINGYRTVDYTEPDDSIARKGYIGLQIHGGPAGQAWYKDIFIKPLD